MKKATTLTAKIIFVIILFASKMQAQCSGPELVTNGDFELGNTGFSTDYSLLVGIVAPSTTHYYLTNADNIWGSGATDHTSGTGNFILVDGSTSTADRLWYNTYSVTPNTDYVFSVWVRFVNAPSPPVYYLSVNGSDISGTATATGTWTNLKGTWNSGANTSATIAFMNTNSDSYGNDFAIDDISFRSLSVAPTLTISSDTTICNGLSTTLNVSGADSYSWAPSTGLSATTGNSVLASPSTPTTYTVTGTTGTCSTDSTITITVISIPPPVSASILSSTNVTCKGLCNGLVTATAASANYLYSWNSVPAQNTALATGLCSGTYVCTVTDTSVCATYSINELVTNGDFSAGNTSFSTDYSYLAPAGFAASGGKFTVFNNPTALNGWSNPGDHTTGSGNMLVADGASTTKRLWYNTYSVLPNTTYTFSTWLVTVNNNNFPVIYLGINGTTISDSITETNGAWKNVSATWNSGAATSATIAVYALAGPGGGDDFAIDDISFKTIINNQGNPSSDTASVYISEPDSLLANPITTAVICKGDSATLSVSTTGGNGGNNYVWSPSGTGTSAAVTVSPASPATYTVLVTDSKGCKDSTQAMVVVNLLPVVNAGTNVSICFGEHAQIGTPSVVGYQYNWSGGASSTAMPSVNPNSPTTYTLTVTDGNGCSDSDMVDVAVKPLPVPNFDLTIDDCSVSYNNTSIGASTYQWNFGDGLNSTVESPVHSYEKAGSYSIQLIATSAEGCTDSVTQVSQVKGPESTLFIPNSFTPNGDGLNDLFIIGSVALTNFEGKIFNRWGELVYSWNDSKMAWDGTYHGQPLPEGTYVCIVKAKSQCNGQVYDYKEMVTILR